ncbi:testis-specific gene 13 protein isoform X2 [Rhinoderma darwinii]|uniref:testis-specific gene 13 protein isoform X2 n=1 Tax=Rhinoderma darwinii TaxID=43563 RepID=UPI003F67FB56
MRTRDRPYTQAEPREVFYLMCYHKTAIEFSAGPDSAHSGLGHFSLLTLAKMDLSYSFNSNVEKEQETLYPPTEDAEGTVQDRRGEVVEEEADLEPHVLQLQKFLGQQLALQFLDPSYEVPVNPVHPLLLEFTGQSAKDYWRLLRENSEAQLQEITTAQGTLKNSLFTKMPSSKCVDQIRDFKRTLRKMYRASKINQDKAVLIMANNTLLDLNEWRKNESPMQFLCKEVIPTKKHFLVPSVKCTGSGEDGVLNEQGPEAEKKSYRFVTEDTYKKLKGEFSKRFRERECQVLKGTYNSSGSIQVHCINANEHRSDCSSITDPAVTDHTWESLTYTALIDSRPSITVQGKGDFRHGQPTKWIVKSATIIDHFNMD